MGSNVVGMWSRTCTLENSGTLVHYQFSRDRDLTLGATGKNLLGQAVWLDEQIVNCLASRLGRTEIH